MNSDKIILAFKDSVVRQSDIDILRGPFWLNDALISFYFEHLTTMFPPQELILFVGPEVTHCLKAGKLEEFPIFLEPLSAKEKNLIFFVLNNNRMWMKSGGTHWSLLVFARADATMYHFDSMSGMNAQEAMNITGKLIQYLSPNGGDFEEVQCTQQNNDYDCGVFVLCHAELVATHYASKKNVQSCPKLCLEAVSSKRTEIIELIYSLKSKANE